MNTDLDGNKILHANNFASIATNGTKYQNLFSYFFGPNLHHDADYYCRSYEHHGYQAMQYGNQSLQRGHHQTEQHGHLTATLSANNATWSSDCNIVYELQNRANRLCKPPDFATWSRDYATGSPNHEIKPPEYATSS